MLRMIRASTEEQAQGESPRASREARALHAESKGWQVREVYHLEGVSGKDVIGHPEAERMLKDIRSGRITGLIFSKLARLARNTRPRESNPADPGLAPTGCPPTRFWRRA
jgi:site-specific DNA recombinase